MPRRTIAQLEGHITDLTTRLSKANFAHAKTRRECKVALSRAIRAEKALELICDLSNNRQITGNFMMAADNESE